MKNAPRPVAVRFLYTVSRLYLNRPGNGSHLIILNYHRIRPDEPFSSRFDDGVFGPTRSEFAAHMEWMTGQYRILSLQELVTCGAEGRIPKRSALVTFDDGYADNYTRAYPVLKALGIPAILFIPSNLIETRSLGWWDLIAYLVKNSSTDSIRFDGERIEVGRNGKQAIAALQTKFHGYDILRIAGAIRELSERSGVEVPRRELQDAELLTWEQIREMHSNGIGIGSHTHNHCVLSALDADAQKREMEESKAMLESRLRSKVATIAYPVGSSGCYTGETKAIARKLGYEAAFPYNTGLNRLSDIDMFDLKRVGNENDLKYFIAQLMKYYLFDRN